MEKCGKVAIVAKKLGRKFIGFELNKEYVRIIERKLGEGFI